MRNREKLVVTSNSDIDKGIKQSLERITKKSVETKESIKERWTKSRKQIGDFSADQWAKARTDVGSMKQDEVQFGKEEILSKLKFLLSELHSAYKSADNIDRHQRMVSIILSILGNDEIIFKTIAEKQYPICPQKREELLKEVQSYFEEYWKEWDSLFGQEIVDYLDENISARLNVKFPDPNKKKLTKVKVQLALPPSSTSVTTTELERQPGDQQESNTETISIQHSTISKAV